MNLTLKKCVALAGLVALTAAAFWPSLFNGFINWDDQLLVVSNPLIVSPQGINFGAIFTTMVGKTYLPVTTLSFALEYHFFRITPFFFHLDNLLLHTGVVLLVFALCLRLRFSWAVSLLAAGIFAIHPMHVESVAWIAERKDVLYAFFYLLALHQYIAYIRSRKVLAYGLSFVFFVLSVLSKSMAVSLPLIFLLIDWWDGRKSSWQTLAEKLPFFLVSAGIAGLMFSFSPPSSVDSAVQAFLIGAWSLMFYIKKFLFPLVLIPLYSLPMPVSIFNAPYALAVASMGVLGYGLWVFRNVRLWIFAAAFYFCSIFFLLRFNTTAQVSVVADRFMYLPSIGFCLLVAFYALEIWRHMSARGFAAKCAAAFCGGLIVVLLAARTFTQCRIWGDEEKFWTSVIRVSPHYVALNNLGHVYGRQGKPRQAIEYFTKALGHRPGYDFWLYQNIGMEYLSLNDYPQALRYYDRSIALEPRCPEAYMLKALLYEKTGEHDLAFENYSKAIEYAPYFAQAYHNRAIIYCRRRQFDKAVEDLTRALRVIPGFLTAYYFRGQIRTWLGRNDMALADFEAALRIDPAYPPVIRQRERLIREGAAFRLDHLDIPADTFKQPQWDPSAYNYYLPDKERFYPLFNRSYVSADE